MIKLTKGVVLLVATIVAGYTSLKPIELSQDQLHMEIRNNHVVEVGENIKAVTVDGKRHEFKVVEVTATSLVGETESIEIDDIVALETRQFSGGKTALLVGGMYAVYGLLAAVAAIATLVP